MDAIAEYIGATTGYDMASADKEQGTLLDLEDVKKVAGLKLPAAATSMRYSAKVRTEAVVRLGVYSVLKLFKKAFKKGIFMSKFILNCEKNDLKISILFSWKKIQFSFG